MSSWLFLGVSVWGAAFTVNAFRPSQRWQFIGPSFFAAWLTGELALWHLAWQVAATAVFVALGALDAWPGWLGLGITLASWFGLVVLVRVARGATQPFLESFDAGEPAIAPDDTTWRAPRRRLLVPFAFGDRRVVRVRNIAYGPAGKRNLLNVLHPAEGARDAPVLFQIHGGGWVIGNKDQQGLPLMNELASRGWVCVALNYRLSPKVHWPAHLEDCKRALAWIKEHVAEYGGDPDRVVVTGGSAGGHLAAMVALTANDPRYQPGFEAADTSVHAAVPFYGVYDMATIFSRPGASAHSQHFGDRFARMVLGTTLAQGRDVFADASPISHVNADAPPFLVVHGRADNLVPVEQARTFVAALRAVSRHPVLYAEIPGASHAFEIFYSPRACRVIHEVARFCESIAARRIDAPTPRPTPEHSRHER